MLIYKDLSFRINGVLFRVHNDIGKYASEAQICDMIAHELKCAGIKYEREYVLQQILPGEHAGRHRVDFIIEDKIILEIKTKRYLSKEDYSQVKRYIKTSNKKLGILINFRDARLHPKRILNSEVDEIAYSHDS